MIMRCNPSETGVYRTSCRVSSLAGQDSHVLQNLRLTIIEHVEKFKCLLKSSVLSQHQGMNTYVCLL
ncbi:hypothetical protein Bca101_075378 [Brassica carinata]